MSTTERLEQKLAEIVAKRGFNDKKVQLLREKIQKRKKIHSEGSLKTHEEKFPHIPPNDRL